MLLRSPAAVRPLDGQHRHLHGRDRQHDGPQELLRGRDRLGEISKQVLERNPDYIVTISMYYGEGPTPEEEILARPGWENVTAVKNGKILNLQNNEALPSGSAAGRGRAGAV